MNTNKPPRIVKRTIKTKKEEPLPLRGEQLTKNIVENDVFSPNGIGIPDLDQGLISYFKEQLNVVHKWEKINIQSFGIQRFNEYYEKKDSLNDVVLPLFGITRLSQVDRGTNFNNIESNIPTNETYTLHQRTELINGKKNVIHYKIPQPLNVDVTYNISFITNLQKDIDKINEIFLYLFANEQLYIKVKEHFMSVKLESIENQNKIELDNRRYFKQNFNLKLKGYLIDPNRIEKIRGVSNIKLSFKKDKEEQNIQACTFNYNEVEIKNGCLLQYKFSFDRKSPDFLEVKSKHNAVFNSDNQISGNNYDVFVNGELQALPFTVTIGDNIKIIVNNKGKRGNRIELFGEII